MPGCRSAFYNYLLRIKRMPRVLGPQWVDTVQPALVSRISLKGAYSAMAARTWSTVSLGAVEQVMKIRSVSSSVRPWSRSFT